MTSTTRAAVRSLRRSASSSPATDCPNAGEAARASRCWKPASAWATTSSPPGPPGATIRHAANAWSSSPSKTIRCGRQTSNARTRIRPRRRWHANSSTPGRRPPAICIGSNSRAAACNFCWPSAMCGPGRASWWPASMRSTSTASRRRATRPCGTAACSRCFRAWPLPRPPWPPGARRVPCARACSTRASRCRRPRAVAASATSPWPGSRRASRLPCHPRAACPPRRRRRRSWSAADWPVRSPRAPWHARASPAASSIATPPRPPKPRATPRACSTAP